MLNLCIQYTQHSSCEGQFSSQSIQSLVLELYRHGLGLLWASLNQTKQKKYLKNCFRIKDFMKVFKLNLFFYPRKKIVSFQTNVLKKILLLKYSRHHFVIRDRHGSPEWRGFDEISLQMILNLQMILPLDHRYCINESLDFLQTKLYNSHNLYVQFKWKQNEISSLSLCLKQLSDVTNLIV